MPRRTKRPSNARNAPSRTQKVAPQVHWRRSCKETTPTPPNTSGKKCSKISCGRGSKKSVDCIKVTSSSRTVQAKGATPPTRDDGSAGRMARATMIEALRTSKSPATFNRCTRGKRSGTGTCEVSKFPCRRRSARARKGHPFDTARPPRIPTFMPNRSALRRARTCPCTRERGHTCGMFNRR